MDEAKPTKSPICTSLKLSFFINDPLIDFVLYHSTFRLAHYLSITR